MSVLKRRLNGILDGRYVIAHNNFDASIDISKNHGVTWVRKRQTDLPNVDAEFFENKRTKMAISADGRYLYLACYMRSAGLLRSTDLLKTAEILNVSGIYVYSAYSIACNGKGDFVAVVYRNGNQYSDLMLSKDYGQTWKISSLYNITVPLMDVVMSYSGKDIVALSSNPNYISHGLYISSDYGVTFRWVHFAGPIKRIAISGNGKYILCYANRTSSTDSYRLYCSGDGGQTWSQCGNGSYYDCHSLDVSYDGKYMLAEGGYGASGGYVSTDYGKTWTVKTMGAGSSFAGAISGSGRYAVIKNRVSPYDMYKSSNDLGSFTRIQTGLEQVNTDCIIMNKLMI